MKAAILLLKLIGSLARPASRRWRRPRGRRTSPSGWWCPSPPAAPPTLGRSLARQLAKELGQTIIVENKPGAGSMLGTREVAGARPDGYTLLLGTTANVFNKYFYKKPLYDLQRDLTPISQLVEIPNFRGQSQAAHRDAG